MPVAELQLPQALTLTRSISVSIYSLDKYHYTYKITIRQPIDERKYYIGVRSSKCKPEDDIYYKSSSRSLKTYLKEHSEVEYTKEILAYFFDRKSALQHEIELHQEFDVARNPLFFNDARQTNTGFCTEGRKMKRDVCRIFDRMEMTLNNFNQWCFFQDNPDYAAGVSAKKSRSKKGNPHSKEHSRNISKALKGFKRPKGCQAGHKNNNAKPANIYDAVTNELIAENVVIRQWSAENEYCQTSLAKTARNPGTIHKGIYARYI